VGREEGKTVWRKERRVDGRKEEGSDSGKTMLRKTGKRTREVWREGGRRREGT
jgi:hypothetical protein